MPHRSLDAYLQRIGDSGPLKTDADTLVRIHRAHGLTIPYENLEIQLGRESPLDEASFADKLVGRARGGWCYEMNGLLTMSLRRAGFRVTRVGGAVARNILGDAIIGNHMVGLVDLDRRYVVDVGLGDGPLDPFPLEERAWNEGKMQFRLERLDAAWWRFHNHEHGLAKTFDFTEEPRELGWYQDMSTALQTDETSIFRQYALASRRTPDGFHALRDTTHFDLRDGKMEQTEISDGNRYLAALAAILGADLGDEARTLWEIVDARAARRVRDAAG